MFWSNKVAQIKASLYKDEFNNSFQDDVTWKKQNIETAVGSYSSKVWRVVKKERRKGGWGRTGGRSPSGLMAD